MRFIASIIALAVPLFVAAAPWKRDAATNLLVLRECLLSLIFSHKPVTVPSPLWSSPYPTPKLMRCRSIASSPEFADVLEQLESKFYSEALAKFKESDFTAAGFSNAQLAIEQFLVIQGDEATHSLVLRVRLFISVIPFVPSDPRVRFL